MASLDFRDDIVAASLKLADFALGIDFGWHSQG
jgi:hypothetical protein